MSRIVATLRGWVAEWHAYRADPLARELCKLPWVKTPRDALWRARGLREISPEAREHLAGEFVQLGLNPFVLDLSRASEDAT